MLLQRNIKLISWFNFCTDFVLFAPVAIIYFAKVTGSLTLGMSIFSIAYVSSALFEVPTGILSDRVGRKKTMVFGALCSTLCIVFYAMGTSYVVLGVGALLQGMGRAFFSGNNDALLHDTLRELGKKDDYHSHLGRTSSMFQAALALSSIAGGLLAEKSFSLVMWVSVVPQIISVFIALQIIEPPHHTQASGNIFAGFADALKGFQRNSKLRLLTVASVIRFAGGESGFFLRSAFYNTLWPLWAIGVLSATTHFLAAAGFYFSGKFIHKVGALKALTVGTIVDRAVNLIALIRPTIASPALMSSTAFNYGVGSVSMNSLMQKEFTDSQRATMASISSVFGSIFFGLCAVGIGYLGDVFGPAKGLIVVNILLLIPLIFYRKIFLGEKRGA